MRCFKTIIAALTLLISVGSTAPGAHAEEQKVLRAAIAVDGDTPPATSFSSDVPKLYAFYLGEALKPGDQLRGVWIAEDVGTAAPKNSKIDEASITVKTPKDSGAFSLTKPTKGWPVGSYRIEIFAGDKLVETAKFKITKAASEDQEEEDSEDEGEEE